MRAFIINLDSATDRWAFIERSFQHSRLELARVAAIPAKELQFPHPNYSARLYRWFHGRANNPREAACYFSHLKAIRMFLAAEESYALIGEDDLTLRPEFDQVLETALQYSACWNILRLTGLKAAHGPKIGSLDSQYSLRTNLSRIKGSGAYVLDRKAAQTLLARLLPMRLPFDHALDREWFFGLRAAFIDPFPCSQLESDFLSSVQPGTYAKFSEAQRLVTTYPYQVFNETTRFLFRGSHYLTLRLKGQSKKLNASKVE